MDDEWEELRRLVLPCSGHSYPMRPSCQYCGERWVKIRAAVERLRDPDFIRREGEEAEAMRAKIAAITSGQAQQPQGRRSSPQPEARSGTPPRSRTRP